MALIELRDVRKIYDLGEVQVHALRGVSLELEDGEYVALIGASGSGKSTMMNTIGCLDRPTSGSYLVRGEDVATMSADERARLRNHRIGFVFQNFNLLSRTSALENVELPLMYRRGISSRKRRQRAIELLKLVGLGNRIHHHPSQLSGGQQQRIAIARALITEPSVLLADEPTGNLDSRTSNEVMHIFRDLNEQQGLLISLVTHDLHVAQCAKRFIVLHDGQIVADTREYEIARLALEQAGRELDPATT